MPQNLSTCILFRIQTFYADYVDELMTELLRFAQLSSDEQLDMAADEVVIPPSLGAEYEKPDRQMAVEKHQTRFKAAPKCQWWEVEAHIVCFGETTSDGSYSTC